MGDISKCIGTNCPLKQKCYRFLAKPDEYYQSFFVDEPYNQQTKTCDFYWEVETKKQKYPKQHK